jgi:hypothetical protein
MQQEWTFKVLGITLRYNELLKLSLKKFRAKKTTKKNIFD